MAKLSAVLLLFLFSWNLNFNNKEKFHPNNTEVFIALFKGATGSSATGIPSLKMKLDAFPTTYVRVYEYNQLEQARSDIKARIKMTGNEQVILIGHSWGGNAVLNFVHNYCNTYRIFNSNPFENHKTEDGERPYEDGQILLDYVITIDPVGSYTKLFWNVSGVNLFERNGSPPGHSIFGNHVHNLDYTNEVHYSTNCPCNEYSYDTYHKYTHTNIDDCDAIQEYIVNKVSERIKKFPKDDDNSW